MSTSKKIKSSARKSTSKCHDSEEIFQSLTGGPLNIGRALAAIRRSDEVTQAEFARKLKIPRQHLNDIEKGRRTVSIDKAVAFAKLLGQPEVVFIQLALQTLVDDAGYSVHVKVAS
jgi:DNA-binding XRE family transcriptional regulator